MLIVFQVIALLTIAAVAYFMARGGGARHQAIRRIMFFAFVVAAGSSVFFPQVWSWAANLLGIARGTDLLLYTLVLTFLGFVASTFRRTRALEADITQLARSVALLSEAQEQRSGDRDD